MKRLAIFISGRGSNFEAISHNIENEALKGVEIALVFSNNPNAKGLEFAKSKGYETLVIDSKGRNDRQSYDSEVLNAIQSFNIDLICLAGYMRIVTDVLVDAYKDKIINIHPALLPSFKGLNAQKQALEYGVKYTGCTVHYVDSGVDTGKIIMQSVVEVSIDDNEDTLSAKILKEEHKLYSKAIEKVLQTSCRNNS